MRYRTWCVSVVLNVCVCVKQHWVLNTIALYLNARYQNAIDNKTKYLYCVGSVDLIGISNLSGNDFEFNSFCDVLYHTRPHLR